MKTFLRKIPVPAAFALIVIGLILGGVATQGGTCFYVEKYAQCTEVAVRYVFGPIAIVLLALGLGRLLASK